MEADYYYSGDPKEYDPRNDYDYLVGENGTGYYRLSDILPEAKIKVTHQNKTRIISGKEFQKEFQTSHFAQSTKYYPYYQNKKCNLTVDQLQKDGMKLGQKCAFCDALVKDHFNPCNN